MNASDASLVARLSKEQRARWTGGDRVLAEEYLQRCPELGSDSSLALELIYGEVVLRVELGEKPQPEEYLQRFPQWELDVRRLFEVHEVVAEGDLVCGVEDPPTTVLPAEETARTAETSVDYSIDIPERECMGELGRGGMGIVLLARHKKLNRLEAVKIPRNAVLEDPGELARFHREARAVAGLRHPNIVQVYEVGEGSGNPYFAMEYIQGNSLAQIVQRSGPLLPTRAARYVAGVASAIQFGHEHGVLHRDIKPGNVLIDSSDQPHVSDFGLARQVERGSDLTATGQTLGTPSYMAPEQISDEYGAVTVRSDVYSLGILLYELLTGRPPFVAETPFDTFIKIRESKPVDPRLRNPRVDRNLATICLKAISNLPAARYASAGDFADDLRRWLDGLPIQARPAGVAERLVRWCWRNKSLASLAATLLLVFLVAIVLVSWKWHEAAKARDAEREQHERAEAILDQSMAAVAGMLSEPGETGLLDLPYIDEERRRMLHGALNFYQSLLQRESTNPKVLLRTAQAYRRVGDINRVLGAHDVARDAYEQGLAVAQALARKSGNTEEAHRERAAISEGLGTLHAKTDPAQAGTFFHQTLELRTELVASHPNRGADQCDLARSHHNVAKLLFDTDRKRYAEAEGYCNEAISRMEQLQRNYAAQPRYRSLLGLFLTTRGALFRATSRPREAQSDYDHAASLLESLVQSHPETLAYRNQLALTLHNLANFLQETGAPEEANSAYTRARVIRERLAAEHPSIPDYEHNLAVTDSSLGVLFKSTGRTEEAEQAFWRAIGIDEKLHREYPEVTDYAISLGGAQLNMGNLLKDKKKDVDGSLRWYTDAIQSLTPIVEQGLGPPRTRYFLGGAYVGRAEAFLKLGRNAEAESDCDEVSRIFTEQMPLEIAGGVADTLVRLCLHERAVQTIKPFREVPTLRAEVMYNFSCIFSLASLAVRSAGDSNSLPKASQTLAEHYADLAMDFLSRARTAGLFRIQENVDKLKHDPDLAGVRSRSDYEEFVTDCEHRINSAQTP